MLSFLLFGTNSFSQDSIRTEERWKFKVEPNLMLPAISGKAGASALPTVQVDQSTSDIFSNLKFAGMLTMKASKNEWTILTDILYASMGTTVKKDPFVNNGELTAKQFSANVGLLRKFYPWLEAGISANLNSVKAGFDVNLINPQNGQPLHFKKSISRTWLDPMIIARTKNQANKEFLYNVTGGIGGFGVGSSLAWNLQGLVGYQFSDLFYLMGGYQLNDVDYKGGQGSSYLLYDMNTRGPLLKIGFNLN